jgi:hypothetical protein
LHCGDHDPSFLERQKKAQVLAMEKIVENIPCGLAHKELYASMDWMDSYMTDMGTLWDIGS